MARYTLVYGLRLVPEGTLQGADEVRLQLESGETAGLTLHTIDGTIPQLRRALDHGRPRSGRPASAGYAAPLPRRRGDAFFEFLPGAAEEDRDRDP